MASADEILKTPLGKELDRDEAGELAAVMERTTLAPGAWLFAAGDDARALHFIIEGELEVVLGDPAGRHTVVAVLRSGQVVGELEVLNRSPRVASVRAKGAVSLLELDGQAFQQLLGIGDSAAYKLLQNMARTLAARLAAVNQKIMARTPPPPPADAVVAEPTGTEIIIEADDLEILDEAWQ